MRERASESERVRERESEYMGERVRERARVSERVRESERVIEWGGTSSPASFSACGPGKSERVRE